MTELVRVGWSVATYPFARKQDVTYNRREGYMTSREICHYMHASLNSDTYIPTSS
jgi:hypothetical protein